MSRLQPPPSQIGEPQDAASTTDACDADRRAALLRMSGYAAAVAPAMLVLMAGRSEAKPPCNVPALELGLKNKGHSGC